MNAINTSAAQLKIVESRAELERLLIDEPDTKRKTSGTFPRSHTVRLLTSNGGMALVAVAAGGLLLLRPTLIKRVIRFVPMGPMLGMLADRFLRKH